MELAQLEPAVAVRGPHHRDVASDAVEPDDAVHRASLDRRLALQLHAELDEERDGGLKVVDDDADVVDPQDRHVPSLVSDADVGSAASRLLSGVTRSGSSTLVRWSWQ